MSWNRERWTLYWWLGVLTFIYVLHGIIDYSRHNERKIQDLERKQSRQTAHKHIKYEHTHNGMYGKAIWETPSQLDK